MTLASASYTQGQATDEPQPIRVLFESDQVRLHRLQLAPGARLELPDHPDALLIPFTLDLDGRIAHDRPTWLAAGTTTLANHAATPFSGMLVELTAPPSDMPASLPPEVVADRIARYSWPYRMERLRVRTIVDNPRVLVTKHSLPAWQPRTEPKHWHAREVVLVYLTGGEIVGAARRLGARRVRRGEFDVLPANVPHASGNLGNDPVEFLMVTAK